MIAFCSAGIEPLSNIPHLSDSWMQDSYVGLHGGIFQFPPGVKILSILH